MDSLDMISITREGTGGKEPGKKVKVATMTGEEGHGGGAACANIPAKCGAVDL